MGKKLVLFSVLLLAVVLFLCTNPTNPFNNAANSRINLVLKNSIGTSDTTLAISDTVGNSVKIGICPHLIQFLDSVHVSMSNWTNGNDSTFWIKGFSSEVDTQWSVFSFASAKKCTVSVTAFIKGEADQLITGVITIYGKPLSATVSPTRDSSVVDSLMTCTVTAVGDAPYTYQWLHGNAELTGKTGVTLLLNHLALGDSGAYYCLVKDKWGDTVTAGPEMLSVKAKPVIVVNTKPVLVVGGKKNILNSDICTLTVSITDPDSGQSHITTLVQGPQGNAFANNIFIWTPPSNFLGADTVVFATIDNGVPPMTDTQKVVIVVSATILPPDSVKGVAGVSRILGNFIFKWNKVGNADAYVVYRSKDTTGFALYATVSDTSFTNNIKDTSFYYYIVATNSKGSSAPSLWVKSTSVNTAPKWAHGAINVTVNEGSTISFDCADSCKDTNGDAVSFQLVSAGPVKDSLIGSVWRYSPLYTDSGLYIVKLKASDGIDSSILTVTLKVVNVPRPPQPQPQTLSTNRNTPLQITLSALDPDGDAITSWTIDTQTTHGTVTLASASQPTATYTPGTDYMGTDYFTFKAAVGGLSSVTSAKVTIRVDTNKVAPQVTQQLVAKTLNKGDSVVFTVGINSSVFPAPLYSWYKGATFLDSTRTNSWKKTNLALADSGYYSVFVTNSVGKDSSGAKLTMQNAPVISPKLAAMTTENSGSTTPISVAVNADAVPAPAYQWYFNGTAISGATANSYSKTWAIADTGTYKVVVSNAAGKDSTSTKLIVDVAPVISAKLSATTTVNPGSSTPIAVTINAGALPSPTYQWYLNGTAISGATANSYLPSANWANTDSGTYKVIVSNVAGKDSSFTKLIVNVAPTIFPKLSATTAVNSGSSTLIAITVTAGAVPAPTYQWYLNGQQINAAVTNSYSKTWSVSDTGTYKVIASNAAGKDSTFTKLLINVAPHVMLPIVDQVQNKGDSVLFTVGMNADAYPAPTFTWYHGATLLANGTQNFWKKTNLAVADSGLYYVIISNSLGRDSSGAHLTINVAPHFTQPLAGQTLNKGDSAVLTVAINTDASPAPTFSWYHAGTLLVINYQTFWKKLNMQEVDSGYYYVIASNSAGRDSTGANVKVNVPPSIITQPQPQQILQNLTISLSATATGTTPFTYQWRKNGVNITTNGTSQAYSYVNALPADSGDYSVIVSNVVKSCTSSVAHVSVVPTYVLTTPCSPIAGGTVVRVKDSVAYPRGYTVHLTANPSQNPPGYQFIGWSGDITDTSSADSIAMTGTKSATANFIGRWNVENSGLTNLVINGFLQKGTDLYTGTYGAGVFVSSNQGATWSLTADTNFTIDSIGDTIRPAYPLKIKCLAGVGNKILAGAYQGGAWRSSDYGMDWDGIDSGITGKKPTSWSFLQMGSTLLTGGNIGVFRSTDTGTSWTLASGISTYAYCFAISGKNVFAGTLLGVYLSTDSGVTWTSVSTGLTFPQVTALAVSGTSIFAGTSGGVYRSDDGGASWNAFNTGMTAASVYSFAVSGSSIYAGTNAGVFLSKDNGNSWRPVDAGITSTTAVYCLSICFGYLYAGTDSGVYRAILP